MLDIPEDYAQVTHTVRHQTLSRSWAFTYGINFSTYAEPPTTLAAILYSLYVGNLGTRTDNNLVFEQCIVRANVGTIDPLTIVYTDTDTGSLSFNGVSPNTAVLVSKVTGVGGRRNKGRMFLPGLLANSDVGETGLLGGAQLTAIQADVNDWFDVLETNATPMYILHNDPPVGVTPTLVSALTVEPLAATQRRRMRP